MLYKVTKYYCTCLKGVGFQIVDVACQQVFLYWWIEAERIWVCNLLQDLAFICSWRKTQHVVLWLEPYMVHRWIKLGWEMGQQVWWKPSWKTSQVDEKRRWGQEISAFWVRGIHKDLQHFALWLRFISSQGLRIHHLGLLANPMLLKTGCPFWCDLLVRTFNLEGGLYLGPWQKGWFPKITCDRLIDLCMTEEGKHM